MLGKKGGLKRFTVIWLVVFVILTIMSLFITGYLINHFSVKINEDASKTLYLIQDNFRQEKYNQLVRSIVNNNGLDDSYQIIPIFKEESELFYDFSEVKEASFVYTNCDMDTFFCEIKDKDNRMLLENQFNL